MSNSSHQSATLDQIAIFILTLEGCESRSQSLGGELDKLAFHYEFIYGIRGHDLTPDQLKRVRRSKRQHPLQPNEIACTLGHERCLQAFLKTEKKFGLIFEDDSTLHDGFASVLQALVTQTAGWEVLMLDYQKKEMPSQKISLGTHEGKEHFIVCPRRMTVSTAGNLYTRKGAQKYLTSLKTFSQATDNHLRESFRYRMLTAEIAPSIVTQRDVVSITGRAELGKVKPVHIGHQLYMKVSQNLISASRATWALVTFQRISKNSPPKTN